jgi:hypothetical protein
MKGTRHSEEQIIAILKQGEAGLTTAALCRQHGITEQTYYRWKAWYGHRFSCSRVIFGELVREGRLDAKGFQGLAKDKLEFIHREASVLRLELGGGTAPSLRWHRTPSTSKDCDGCFGSERNRLFAASMDIILQQYYGGWTKR